MTYARVMGPAAVKVAAQPIGVRGGFFAPCGRRVVSRPFFSVSSFLSRPLDISQLFIHHNICSYVLLFNLRQYEGTYLYLGSYSKDSVAQSPNKCQSSWESWKPGAVEIAHIPVSQLLCDVLRYHKIWWPRRSDLFFLRLYITTQTLRMYAHSLPYEQTYINTTSIRILED